VQPPGLASLADIDEFALRDTCAGCGPAPPDQWGFDELPVQAVAGIASVVRSALMKSLKACRCEVCRRWLQVHDEPADERQDDGGQLGAAECAEALFERCQPVGGGLQAKAWRGAAARGRHGTHLPYAKAGQRAPRGNGQRELDAG